MTQDKYLATYRYHGPNKLNQGRSTVINDETALWAARMCVGEGGRNCSYEKVSAMLWALMNRWILHPGRRHWPSFIYMMRRFSQPINPRWQEGGDLARKHAGKPSTTPARLRRRARISALKWESISYTIFLTIREFRHGRLSPPYQLKKLDHPRISNWASYKGLPEKYPWGIAFEKWQYPDWFFEDIRLINGSVVIDHWNKK